MIRGFLELFNKLLELFIKLLILSTHQKYGHNQVKTIVKTMRLKNTQKPLITTQKPLVLVV